MSKKVERMRKRRAKRKKSTVKEELPNEPLAIYPSPLRKEKPNFNYLLKIIFSILLVTFIAIMFQSNTTFSHQVQSFVEKTMSREFQFARISQWYENKFGTPLTFLGRKEEGNQSEQAILVSGKVLEDFQANGQGILVETSINASVEVMKDGVVIWVGEKNEIGQTVVVQQADGGEIWYGQMKDISVHVYDKVENGQTIGKVTGNHMGTYYLAIKKDGIFIDPSKVIAFE